MLVFTATIPLTDANTDLPMPSAACLMQMLNNRICSRSEEHGAVDRLTRLGDVADTPSFGSR
jgi:hypothetical protein